MSEENKYTFENEEYRRTYWHTCSHVLAQAVKRLHPEVKLAIGPSIEKRLLLRSGRALCLHPREPGRDRGRNAQDARAEAGAL